MSVKEVEEARRNGRLPNLDGGETKDAFVLKRSGEKWPLSNGGALQATVQSTTDGRSSVYSYRFPGSNSWYPVEVSTLTGRVIVDGGLTQYVVSGGRLVGYCDVRHEVSRAADILEALYAKSLSMIKPETPLDAGQAARFIEESLGVPVRSIGGEGSVHWHDVLPVAKSAAASVISRLRSIASDSAATVVKVAKALDFLARWAPGVSLQALFDNKAFLTEALLACRPPEPPVAEAGVTRQDPSSYKDPLAAAEAMSSEERWPDTLRWVSSHKGSPLVMEIASILHGDHRVPGLLGAIGARYILTDKAAGHLLMHLADSDAAAWVASNIQDVRANISGLARLQLSAMKAVLSKQPELIPLLVREAGGGSASQQLRYMVQHLWEAGWLDVKQEGLTEALGGV